MSPLALATIVSFFATLVAILLNLQIVDGFADSWLKGRAKWHARKRARQQLEKRRKAWEEMAKVKIPENHAPEASVSFRYSNAALADVDEIQRAYEISKSGKHTRISLEWETQRVPRGFKEFAAKYDSLLHQASARLGRVLVAADIREIRQAAIRAFVSRDEFATFVTHHQINEPNSKPFVFEGPQDDRKSMVMATWPEPGDAINEIKDEIRQANDRLLRDQEARAFTRDTFIEGKMSRAAEKSLDKWAKQVVASMFRCPSAAALDPVYGMRAAKPTPSNSSQVD